MDVMKSQWMGHQLKSAFSRSGERKNEVYCAVKANQLICVGRQGCCYHGDVLACRCPHTRMHAVALKPDFKQGPGCIVTVCIFNPCMCKCECRLCGHDLRGQALVRAERFGLLKLSGLEQCVPHSQMGQDCWVAVSESEKYPHTNASHQDS